MPTLANDIWNGNIESGRSNVSVEHMEKISK